MQTTTRNTASKFLSSYARLTSARQFACRLLTSTLMGEVTEACIARIASECGLSECGKEKIIDAALDAGLVRATIIDAQLSGYGFVPALTAGSAA